MVSDVPVLEKSTAVRGDVNDITIRPVKGLFDFLRFCRLPRLLYTGNPGFAPALDAERWTLHAATLNPHFKLVESQKFLARKDGKWAGRIFAQVYKSEFVPRAASRFQFGCLDAIDDAAVIEGLLSTAENWLRARGAQIIHGPFSPSINCELGLLVEGFDTTPMFMAPWNPPYLKESLERRGYIKARDLISYQYDVTEADRVAKPGILARPEWRDRVKIRAIDLNNMKEEGKPIVEIFNDAWSENWGFVPFPFDQFMAMADTLKYVMPEEGGVMIELDGKVEAFGVLLPNLFEITKDLGGKLLPFNFIRLISRIRHHKYKTGGLVLFGMRKALHRQVAGGAVLLGFIEECRRRSSNSAYEHVEFGWVLEDNFAMRRPIEMCGAKIDKIHRIYEKTLAA
jgi:hypothetical protein